MELSDISGYVVVFRLIQSQLEIRAVSAAGAGFYADRASRIAPSKRSQVIKNGIR